MLSFRSFFGRATSKAGRPVPRTQKFRPGFRPRLECLEDRTLLNARFIVPVGAPVDNVSTFATLSSALTTPGLASGDTITIRARSAPGQVGTADLQSASARVTNLTIQGDPSVSPMSIPEFDVDTSSTFTASQAGFTLRNVNVGLVGTGQLNFATNVFITGSTLTNRGVTLPITTGAIVFGGTHDVLTHSTLVDTSATHSNLLAITATAGSSNLISDNELIENDSANAAIAYVGAGTGAVTDMLVGNAITSNATTGFLEHGIDIAAPVSGLTIEDNTIADNGAAVGATIGIDVAAGASGILIRDNVLSLMGSGARGVRIAAGTTGATNTSARLLFNHLSASGGTGLEVLVPAASTATDDLTVVAEADDFHNDQFGVHVITGANTTASNLVVDLGGGGSSKGGNDFRDTPATASATGGAIVVSGSNPSAAFTVQAQNNIFGTGFVATSAVFNSGFANASINVSGNLTDKAAFVQTIYEDFLHRLGDLNNPMDAGGGLKASPSVVASSAVRSPEGLGVLVDDLYERVLGRAADANGRANAVIFMQNGGTAEQLIVSMVTSPEYRGRYGSDSAYVQSLYNLLLGRVASQDEVDATVAAMTTYGAAAVGNDFVFSREFRGDVVSEMYGGMSGETAMMASSVSAVFPDLLHRRASSEDVFNTVNSGLDLLSLEVLFASSPEFFMNG